MKLKVKRLKDNAKLPTRGSKKAAAVDLYACIDNKIEVAPGGTAIIPSGIACEIPEGYFGAIVPRSSVGIKRHLSLANNMGVIDEDYRGEIMMAFVNHGSQIETIEPGERLSQMILLPYVLIDIEETNELSDTERGEGGIGSTGK